MTDRELLELAAKAAGYDDAEYQEGEWMEIRYGFAAAMWSDKLHDETGQGHWNPLADDGDALRLAAKLKIDLEWQATSGFPEPAVEAYRREEAEAVFCASEHEDDYRRAIVRAAAEIGKNMP